MSLNISEADAYVQSYFIDSKDWFKADEPRKQTILNVAERALKNRCKKFFGDSPYVLPDEAVFEFAAILSVVYNDTNKMQQYGIAGYSITGVGSFTFKELATSGLTGVNAEEIIPPQVLKMVADANNRDDFGSRSVGWLIV